jgi:acetyl esterase
LVGGDSAGGTLATVVALLLRDKGVTELAGQILIYPVTDYYDPPTVSYVENDEGYGLTRNGMIWFWDHYLNDKSEANDFRAAPLRAASLRGLPRAFVVTAEFDVLRDEAQAYAKRMAEQGVEVTHVFVEGMNHGFMSSPMEFPFLSQGKDVLRSMAEWIGVVR